MIGNRAALGGTPCRDVALACLEAGLAAADPERIIETSVGLEGDVLRVGPHRFDLSDVDDLVVVGGGKAAGRVAAALESPSVLDGRIADGAVVTDAPAPTTRIECLPGDHPVPSERGVASTSRVLDRLEAVDGDDLVLAVITGGASALLCAPAPDVSLASIAATTETLLRRGASIDELNAVRKHLSRIKGGGLARAAAPAPVVGLVLSDVVGNDLSVIASGPTAPDPSTFGDAIEVLERHDVDVPPDVECRLRRGAEGDLEETPGPGTALFEGVTNVVLADGATPMRAAAEAASERGYATLALTSRLRGEAAEAGRFHAAVIEECLASGAPVAAPAAVVSGGETTVTVTGEGTGGPNQSFALAAALELRGIEGVALAAIDTDGIDGPTEAAGALVDGDTVGEPGAAREALETNDAGTYLESHGDLVLTGRTGTNLNDLRVAIVAEGGDPEQVEPAADR